MRRGRAARTRVRPSGPLRVAVIRGEALNPFEMQTFARLQPEVAPLAVGSTAANYEVSRLGMPTVALRPYASGRTARAVERRLGDRLPLTMPTTDFLRGLPAAVASADVLHAAETVLPVSDQAARIARRRGVPLVLTCWENIPFRYDDDPLLRARKARVKDAASAYVAVTPSAASALEEEGVDRALIHVVPAGIDCARFSPDVPPSDLRQQLGLAPSDVVALYVGRLIQEKGVTELVRALASTGLPHLHLAIIGSGNQSERVLLAAQSLGVASQVHLLTHSPYDALPGHYAAADFTVAPSLSTPYWQEQFGMVLVEAMASGRPTITTRTGSIPEVIRDVGVLVDDYDVPALADALTKLTVDSGLRVELGARARRFAEAEYDVPVVSARLARVYDGLFEDARRP